jgi:hypothetical protein
MHQYAVSMHIAATRVLHTVQKRRPVAERLLRPELTWVGERARLPLQQFAGLEIWWRCKRCNARLVPTAQDLRGPLTRRGQDRMNGSSVTVAGVPAAPTATLVPDALASR